jgi:hypothetical protein
VSVDPQAVVVLSVEGNPVLAPLREVKLPVGYDVPGPPRRISATVQRVVRDTAKSALLKRMYNYTCQICRERVQIAENLFLIEVHHVRPLGRDHCGFDHFDNMLVLCPNHHALFDYGVPHFVSSKIIKIFGQQSH